MSLVRQQVISLERYADMMKYAIKSSYTHNVHSFLIYSYISFWYLYTYPREI